jgi:hypothetical protein
MLDLESLSKAELIKLIEAYGKSWLAHDGCWFLASEKKYGMDVAIELDTESWRLFTVAEAKRIMSTFDIPQDGGLDSLSKALDYRLYATVNKQSQSRPDDHTLIFTMDECRVQATRRRKKLPDFPCKSVGIVEYQGFAHTIDPRIKTECLVCPPDEEERPYYCQWKFTI